MNKRILYLLLLLPVLARSATTSALFGFRSVTDSTYGATCGTTSDDSAAFQSALNAANTAGGGTVYVPACTGANYYYFLTALTMPSNVTLLCQKGATLKPRADAATTYPGSHGSGTGLLGFYGVTNAGVNGCKIDTTNVAVASNQPNPIEVGPSTPWTGTRADGVTIQNNTILATNHSIGTYMTWVRQSDNVKVLNNTYDGGQSTYTATTDQQGIEVIAGRHVEIAGNKVKNIGRTGILVSTFENASFPSYENIDINVHDNNIEVAANGIVLVATKDTGTNYNYADGVTISNNAIKDPWKIGIQAGVTTAPAVLTSLFRNILIDGNVVNMGVVSQNPFGMSLLFGSALTTATGFTVSNNKFYGGKGADANAQTGLLMTFVRNVTFIGNSWSGGDTSTAAYVVYITVSSASENVTFIGNYFGQSNGGTVYIGLGSNYVWTGNTFDGYNAVTDGAGVFNSQGASSRWIVSGNTFTKDPNNASNEGYLVAGTPSVATGWVWRDNNYGYATGFNRQADGLWDGSCPTSGAAINANSHGCVKINTTGTTVTVTNAQVRANSRIVATQATGTPTAFTTAPANGSFTITLGTACAVANCDFYYEIFN